MSNINNTCNKGEETKLIISSLLTDMITKVLLMRQQHLASCETKYILLSLFTKHKQT